MAHSRISGRNDIHMIAPVESIAAVRVYGSLESWLGLGVSKNLSWGAFYMNKTANIMGITSHEETRAGHRKSTLFTVSAQSSETAD